MQILEKGQYSGAVEILSHENGLLTTITNYDNERFNSAVHYHENTHLSFVLNGASIERKQSSYDRIPGQIAFYGAGEVHQVRQVLKSSRHINLEIEKTFLEKYTLTD